MTHPFLNCKIKRNAPGENVILHGCAANVYRENSWAKMWKILDFEDDKNDGVEGEQWKLICRGDC